MTGGANAVYSGADVLNETYSVDPWGNMQQSGNFNFQQSYNPANNQINGYSYDAAGDLLNDGMNNYTYDGEGMLTSVNGAQYTYDALQQRVEKTGGSNPAELIYFNGKPVALYNPTSGAWTDLIWAGSNIVAEVPGSQSATPTYRLLDHEGSLVAATDNSGNVLGTNLLTPYAQAMVSGTSDPYLYTGLFQDTEYGGDAALYRNYSAEQSRWLTPDPYNGSYDLMNPQSFNRYMYVNGNPLGYVDLSGLVDGWATGIGGGPCSAVNKQFGLSGTDSLSPGGFNYCSPFASVMTFVLSPLLVPIADEAVKGVNAVFGTSFATDVPIGEIVPFVAAAITIGCSIDSSTSSCGPSGITNLIPGNWGKAAGDGIAVATAISCSMGGLSNPVCDGFVVYNVANALFSVFNDLFNGPAQFTGSLLPRPSALGGLGTSPIGIPNGNLSAPKILGQAGGIIQSPGMLAQ